MAEGRDSSDHVSWTAEGDGGGLDDASATSAGGRPPPTGRPDAATRRRRGTGWIVTSALLLLLAGASILINGLWALHADQAIRTSVRGQLLFSENNLDTWGWIYTGTGAALIGVGLAVFWRAPWAVSLGMVAAGAAILVACLWLFTAYWPDALVSILLNGVVLYGLGAYGFETVGA